jgi:hypothetical protein
MAKRCLECGTDNEDYAQKCTGCGGSLIEVATPQPPSTGGPTVVELPPGSGAVRTAPGFFKIKAPPRAKTAFMLGFLASLLVFLNSYFSGMVVAIPISFSPPSYLYFPGDVVGIVLAFCMLIASFMIFGRKEYTGGAALLVLSLLSMAVGGGFGIGLLLGIVGAMIGFLKK